MVIYVIIDVFVYLKFYLICGVGEYIFFCKMVLCKIICLFNCYIIVMFYCINLSVYFNYYRIIFNC